MNFEYEAALYKGRFFYTTNVSYDVWTVGGYKKLTITKKSLTEKSAHQKIDKIVNKVYKRLLRRKAFYTTKGNIHE